MKHDYIEINKDLIPYDFDILLADEWFNLKFDYNNTGDLFTVTLSKDGEVICTEPIIYGKALFADVFQSDRYPAVEIVPYDESGQETAVTFENLSRTVLLIIDDGGDDDE